MSVNVNLTEKERMLISESLCRCIEVMNVAPEPWKDQDKVNDMTTLVHEKFETYILVRQEMIKIREMEAAHDKQVQERFQGSQQEFGDIDYDNDGAHEGWEGSREGMLAAEEAPEEEVEESGPDEAQP